MNSQGQPMSYEELKERYDRIAALPENQFVLDLKSSDEESDDASKEENEILQKLLLKKKRLERVSYLKSLIAMEEESSSSSEDENGEQKLKHPNDKEIRRLKIQLREVEAEQRAFKAKQQDQWQSMKAKQDAEREQIDKDFMAEMMEIKKEYEEGEKRLKEGLILELENKKKQYQWEYENMRIDSDFEKAGTSFKRQLRPRSTQGKVDTTTPKPSETFHETSVPIQCSSKGSKRYTELESRVLKSIKRKKHLSSASVSTPEQRVLRPRGRQNSESGSATVENHQSQDKQKPEYTGMLRAAEIEEDLTLFRNFGKRLTEDPTKPEESSCSSSESEESIEDDSNVNTLPTHVDARIESGKLFFEKRWFHRGQPVFVEVREGREQTLGIINAIHEDAIIVRKMNSHMKLLVPLESLRNGEMVISRRA